MKWNIQQMVTLSLLGEDERGAILVVLVCVHVCVCVWVGVRAWVLNRMCSLLPGYLCCY